jgi:hypothetical protein
VDWIHVAKCKDNWRALVNTVMIFGLYQMQKISWYDNYQSLKN